MSLSFAAPGALVTGSVAAQIYAQLMDVPGHPQAQLGDSRFVDNPPHFANIPAMGVSPLITTGHMRAYARFAASQGRIVYDRVSQQHILIARGHDTNLTGVRVLANVDMTDADLDYTHVNVIEIVPPKISGDDSLPVVNVSPADSLGFIYWLNELLLEERQAERIPAGAFFMLPSGDEFEYLARGPEGTNQFGTHDGQAPDLSKRPYQNIEEALHDDGGVKWGEGTIRGLCGVLWQWARNRHQNIAYVEASGGSWVNVDQDVLHAAFRDFSNLDFRRGIVGFRLVLPRTP
jgi:formylglycine-generating enzyme required for sulfatase activity